jgi:hypothetical protein
MDVMDRSTRARIESLLYEVRRFPERAPWDPEALARRFQLDPVVVRGLLETEGVAFVGDADGEADPNSTTMVMRVDDVGL